jgi:hypothetical protein
MSMTFSEARDAIYGNINSTWLANAVFVFGEAAELRFADVEVGTPIPQDAPWGYCQMSVTMTRQAGLRNDQMRRYRTRGVVVVDVHVPRHSSESSHKALLMGDRLRRALEGTRDGSVWYRNVTSTPVVNNQVFAVARVRADFEYTEEGESDAQ